MCVCTCRFFVVPLHPQMKRNIFIWIVLGVLCGCRVQQPISCERFADDVRRDVPFSINTLTRVANHEDIFAFKCDAYISLLPDYEIDKDGASMVYKTTFMSTHDKQPVNTIWRNIVINRKNKRVLCIDRLLNDGKTFGYVYVLQSETKEYSDEHTYHFDVSDHSLLINVSGAIENMAELSVTTLNTLQQ